jgi:cytochrome c oxidase subunit II
VSAMTSRRIVLASGIATVAGLVLGRAHADDRVIAVVARRFVFLPGTLALKLGEPVVLEFTAPEVVMGFSVPALKIRTDIIPGQVARLRLVPERAGEFPFLCDVFCGDGHEGMSGLLVVT